MYRFRKWWLHCSYRQDSWQILDSISMPVSKSLWIQTRYLMSHCLILIYMKCTALYREGVVTLRCWMCVPAESLVEMISNWCCTWEEVQRQTTTHAAISEECKGEETFRRRKAWSIALTLLLVQITQGYTTAHLHNFLHVNTGLWAGVALLLPGLLEIIFTCFRHQNLSWSYSVLRLDRLFFFF